MTHGFHSHVHMTPSFHSHTTTHSHHHIPSHTHHSGHHHHHSHTNNPSGHHHNHSHKKNHHAVDSLPINTLNNNPLTNNAVNSCKNAHASKPLPINSHNPQDYQILATLHSSPTSTTYKARYLNSKTLLTIKVFKNYNKLEDVYGLTRATVLAKLCIDHPNILGVHCSFKHQDELWIVMPFTKVESLNCLLKKSSSPHGMSETRIASILKKTLKAMDCVHAYGEVHDNIDLDHVFVNKGKDVKLDIGILNFNNEEINGKRPVWMTAPDSKSSNKVDIWMFGLLAMDLFYGGNIPVSNREELYRLVSAIKASDGEELSRLVPVIKESKKSCCNLIFGCLGRSNSGRMMPSRLLGEVIAKCVDRNPLRRPSATTLLKHEFFNKA